jgi:hypothetical protein
LWTTASRDVVQRVFEPLEQHKGPPGYYLLAIWGIYFPWSVLLPLTFAIAWRHRHEPAIVFALAAVIGPWLMLECVQTKLPHYLLPILPPLAYLTADAVVRCLGGEHGDLASRATRSAILAWALVTGVIADAAAPLGVRWGLAKPGPLLLLGAVGTLYAAAVLFLFLLRRPRGGLLTIGLGMMLLMSMIFGHYLPCAPFLQLSVRLGQILRENGAGAADTRPGDVQMIAYKEPSLAFYQGGTIREQSENDFLLTHPPQQWPRWIVIRGDVWDRMPDAVKAHVDVVGGARGLNLADRGRTWTVYVLRKRPG